MTGKNTENSKGKYCVTIRHYDGRLIASYKSDHKEDCEKTYERMCKVYKYRAQVSKTTM